MESRMWRRVACRISGLVVQAGGAVPSHCAVGHGLAALDGGGILEVEKDIGSGGRVESFGVPSWIARSVITGRLDGDLSDSTDLRQAAEFLGTTPEESALSG